MTTGAYTGPEILGFIAAAGVLVTALGAVIVNIIVALRTTTKIAAVEQKTDGLINQVHEVHTLTNSGLAAVKAELATANALNAELRGAVADLKAEREKTALAVATAIVPGASELSKQNAQRLDAIDETARNPKTTPKDTT